MSESGRVAAGAAERIADPAWTGEMVLARGHALVEPFLRDAVDGMPASVRRIAGYHMGWLDEDGCQATAGRGKGVRSALALLSAEAVGGAAEVAVPAAAAVELAHNSSLVHDDVIDRDATRRHRRTVWSVFGTSAAVLAGDALLALATEVLATSGHAAAQAATAMVSSAVLGLVEGQLEDLAFEGCRDVDLARCLGMVERKTALLMGCACAVGAAYGNGAPSQVERLRSFGRQLGFGFQLVDDHLGIWGDPKVTGKPVHSDIRNRKKSLPVVAAMASGTAAGRELAALYELPGPLSTADVARAATLVEQAGARRWGDAQLEVFMARALRELELARIRPQAAAALRAVASMIASLR